MVPSGAVTFDPAEALKKLQPVPLVMAELVIRFVDAASTSNPADVMRAAPAVNRVVPSRL